MTLAAPVVAKIPVVEKEMFVKATREIGTTPSNAIRMFISAFNKRGSFPFDISNPMGLNEETMNAIRDTDSGVGLSKKFKSVDKMFEELDV